MKKMLFPALLMMAILSAACQKDQAAAGDNYGNGPRTNVPASLQGNWMYGNFSMTEYWSQNPADYLGNAVQFAIAFKFMADGRYEQYFTSSTVTGGIASYQQSVTKGTVEINSSSHTIVTHANAAHYKRSRNGHTEEERDLEKNELTTTSSYSFTEGTEAGGTRAIYLKLNNSGNALPFLQKF